MGLLDAIHKIRILDTDTTLTSRTEWYVSVGLCPLWSWFGEWVLSPRCTGLLQSWRLHKCYATFNWNLC